VTALLEPNQAPRVHLMSTSKMSSSHLSNLGHTPLSPCRSASSVLVASVLLMRG
jgi:hypothetical protein